MVPLGRVSALRWRPTGFPLNRVVGSVNHSRRPQYTSYPNRCRQCVTECADFSRQMTDGNQVWAGRIRILPDQIASQSSASRHRSVTCAENRRPGPDLTLSRLFDVPGAPARDRPPRTSRVFLPELRVAGVADMRRRVRLVARCSLRSPPTVALSRPNSARTSRYRKSTRWSCRPGLFRPTRRTALVGHRTKTHNQVCCYHSHPLRVDLFNCTS